MNTPEPEAGDEFITARAVWKLTGIPEKQVKDVARRGHLTYRRPAPGTTCQVRYSKASALALVASLIVPARTPAPPRPNPPAEAVPR